MSAKFSRELEPVVAGQVIEVRGKTEESDRFDINLCAGDEDDAGDIMLHISVRFGEDISEIVRNTYDAEAGWGDEEITEENPVAASGDFKFTISVGAESFSISIDGKAFCSYAFRKPLNEIKRLNIEGDFKEILEVKQSA
jgi:Galactoside-binding lectin